MRATGVPSDQFDEEAALEEEASGGEFRGGGAGRRFGGRGQFESGEFGPGSGFGTGRTGFSGVLDPYGGYPRSSRPIGGMQASPYGGPPPPMAVRSVAPAPTAAAGQALAEPLGSIPTGRSPRLLCRTSSRPACATINSRRARGSSCGRSSAAVFAGNSLGQQLTRPATS